MKPQIEVTASKPSKATLVVGFFSSEESLEENGTLRAPKVSGAASSPPPAPILGPQESVQSVAPTDPITIHPGIVKKKGAEFAIPDLDNEQDTYYTLDIAVAKHAKAVNASKNMMQLFFEYRNGRRFITSINQ